MQTMRKEDLVQLNGGGPGVACGIAMGITVGTTIFNPLLGLYLLSKAIGVCAIEAAVT